MINGVSVLDFRHHLKYSRRDKPRARKQKPLDLTEVKKTHTINLSVLMKAFTPVLSSRKSSKFTQTPSLYPTHGVNKREESLRNMES